MKSSGRKIELTSLDDLFTTEENRQEAKLEKIRDIPLSELHPFKNHPFHVRDDEAMMETADSVRSMACWFRPLPDQTPTEGMSWCPVTGGTGPASLPEWRPCRLLSGSWMTMPLCW